VLGHVCYVTKFEILSLTENYREHCKLASLPEQFAIPIRRQVRIPRGYRFHNSRAKRTNSLPASRESDTESTAGVGGLTLISELATLIAAASVTRGRSQRIRA